MKYLVTICLTAVAITFLVCATCLEVACLHMQIITLPLRKPSVEIVPGA
jgi:hypothetical protein